MSQDDQLKQDGAQMALLREWLARHRTELEMLPPGIPLREIQLSLISNMERHISPKSGADILDRVEELEKAALNHLTEMGQCIEEHHVANDCHADELEQALVGCVQMLLAMVRAPGHESLAFECLGPAHDVLVKIHGIELVDHEIWGLPPKG